MTDRANKESAAEVEREIEAARDRLRETLGEIGDRLTPREITEEVLSYAKDAGKHLVEKVKRDTASNPIPYALLATGALWLIFRPKFDGVWNSTADTAKRATSAATNQAAMGVSKAASAVGSAAASVADSAASAATSAARTTSRLGQKAVNAASDLGRRTGEVADNAWRGSRDITRKSKTWLDDTTDDIELRFNRTLEERPLLIGGVAAAAGIVLASLLPTTRLEKRYLGDAAEQAKSRATDMARNLRQKTSRVVDAAKDAARSEGLTPGALGDAAGRVVQAAKTTARSELGDEETEGAFGRG